MRIRLKSILLLFCLFAATAANAKEEPIRTKEEPIQLFPRTYGYFSKGDSESQTITYDHAYGQYGWKNSQSMELSAFKCIVLEIEPTDSRVEIHVLYEGDEKGICIGKVNAGESKVICEFDGHRKVEAIYLAKSKVGVVRIIKFLLAEETL